MYIQHNGHIARCCTWKHSFWQVGNVLNIFSICGRDSHTLTSDGRNVTTLYLMNCDLSTSNSWYRVKTTNYWYFLRQGCVTMLCLGLLFIEALKVRFLFSIFSPVPANLSLLFFVFTSNDTQLKLLNLGVCWLLTHFLTVNDLRVAVLCLYGTDFVRVLSFDGML